MLIQPLTVGPIVGFTSAESVRLWGRGDSEVHLGKPRRCLGVVRLRAKGASSWRKTRFVEMNLNFDMTCVAVLDDLAPEKTYEYQFGYLFADFDPKSIAENLELDWSQLETYTFCSGTSDATRPRSFIFGSCRYLLRILGGSFFDDRGDKTFRSINEQIEGSDETPARPIDMMFMLGDQIYADDLLYVGIDSTVEQYNARYRDAFTQPELRKLLSRVPNYMTFDDHEIQNDWPHSATPLAWVTKYPAAVHSLLTYQLSHSPLYELNGQRRIQGVPEKLWYNFSDGCCDFFFTDTRTERYLSSNEEERELINDQQYDALTNWLADGSGRVKLIASATLLFPDNIAGSGDAWGGYLRQRTQLLDFIRKNRIKRVVALSGDIHASLTAEMVHASDSDFKVISLISSPFFWPYPHSKPKNFVLSGYLRTLPPAGGYIVQECGPIHCTDNFTRVTVNLDGLTAECYGRKGELLGVKAHRF